MAKFSSEQLSDHLYFNKLPEVYRIYDKAQYPKYPLKRYLQSLLYGGFKPIVDSVPGLFELIDPETCPDEWLWLLLECFGIPYFDDILPVYQRRLVSGIGELTRRRGTYACVRYLARLLTGMEVELTREDREGKIYLTVKLIAETSEQAANLEISTAVLERYLEYWIPFWLNPEVTTEVRTQEIKSRTYMNTLVTYIASYSIIPDLEGGSV